MRSCRRACCRNLAPVHDDIVHGVLNLAPEVRQLGGQLVALPLKPRYVPTQAIGLGPKLIPLLAQGIVQSQKLLMAATESSE